MSTRTLSFSKLTTAKQSSRAGWRSCINSKRTLGERTKPPSATRFARAWKFGKRLVDLRNGKKILQPGVLKEHADREKVHRSELSARMKFADKFPTEEQLSTAVETYKSWTAIRQKPLTNRKRKADGNSAATPPTDDLAIPSRDRCTGQLRRILEQLRRIRTSLEDMRGAELGKAILPYLAGSQFRDSTDHSGGQGAE